MRPLVGLLRPGRVLGAWIRLAWVDGQFAKLDIATRAQLAVDVTRHRGSEPADTADSAGG